MPWFDGSANNPAADTTIVTTGALAVGTYNVTALITTSDAATLGSIDFELVRGGAVISFQRFNVGGPTGDFNSGFQNVGLSIGTANDSWRLRTRVGAAAGVVSGSIITTKIT